VNLCIFFIHLCTQTQGFFHDFRDISENVIVTISPSAFTGLSSLNELFVFVSLLCFYVVVAVILNNKGNRLN
jgi:hypothetical protein